MEFIFGDLANDFTLDETNVLLALTQFTEPLLVERIGELAEVAIELAEKALRSLANRSLVIPDLEERAFTLMTMFGDFLRRKWPETITETRSRLVRKAYIKP